MLRLNLKQDTLTNLRFGYSPLVELSVSYRVLRGNYAEAVYWRWLEEARRATSDVEYPMMDHLILVGELFISNGRKTMPSGYIPDFLTPTPDYPITDIEVEFERLMQLDASVIRESIGVLLQYMGENDVVCHFMAYPHEAMAQLILELRDYWQRTLAHHWHRMIAVLENDILYHSRVLTLDGAESMFPTLNEFVNYQDGAITIDSTTLKPCDPTSERANKKLAHNKKRELEVNSDSFHLVPVIFGADGIYYQVSDPWQPMILYTPRGAGLWNYETPEPSEALELVMGAGKARILLALDTPFSTGELARKLSLTAGAVSQQLGKLHQAGLVESHRSGKHVFYRLSERGTQLMVLFG